MRTTDLFSNNRSAKRLNESLAKTFGQKLNLESFSIEQLEDARNKLRTQIYTARSSSNFNETVENDTLSKAQFMHDAIVAELSERDEPIVDNTVQEGHSPEVEEFLTKVANDPQAGYDHLYDAQMGKFGKEIERVVQDMYDDITIDTGYHGDDDFEQIYDRMLDNIEADYADKDVKEGDDVDARNPPLDITGIEYYEATGGRDTMIPAIIKTLGLPNWVDDIMYFDDADLVFYEKTVATLDDTIGDMAEKTKAFMDRNPEYVRKAMSSQANSSVKEGAMSEIAAELSQVADDEDYDTLYKMLSDDGPVGEYLQDKIQDITGETGLHPKDDFEKIESMLMDIVQQEFGGQSDDEGGDTDDGYALASAGHGSDEDYGTFNQGEGYDMDQVRADAAAGIKKSIDKQSDDRMAKMRSDKNKGFMAKVGDKIIGGAKGAAKGFMGKESIEQTGDNMSNLREGEIQQASAIVTAKTMVDRVGRWIEELSGMENDTLLQLGDSIRDEMGQEQAKAFIQAVAPAIQQALDTLKTTRDTLSTGVRSLASGEQPTDMLGAEPGADMAAPAEPDAMNPAADDMTGEPAGDDFDAAEPAAGGLGDAGREQRESIDRQSRLMKVLAG